MKWSIGTKIGSGYALALIVLIIIGVTGYQSINRLIDDINLVAHSREVIDKCKDVLSDLIDAETGQRGFIITGEEPFLEPYSLG